MGYRSRVPVTKPLLSKKQQQKRLQWAREHQDWDAAQWFRVMFSDESKFCISFGNQGTRVWRRFRGAESSKLLEAECQIPSVSDGMGSHVFVWCWTPLFPSLLCECCCLPGSVGAFLNTKCRAAIWR